MRRLPARPSVTEFKKSTQNALIRRAGQCIDSTAARTQWDGFKRSAKVSHRQLKSTLHNLNNYRCFYCDSDDGGAIDHYEAISRAPNQTFNWSNHYLSCTDCNSKYKANRYDLIESDQPCLLDPFEIDPGVHLECLDNGDLIGLTEEGRQTLNVLGLGRNGNDEVERPRPQDRRSTAWKRYHRLIKDYVREKQAQNTDEIEDIATCLKTNANHLVFRSLVKTALAPNGEELYPQVRQAVDRFPELKVWAGLL